MGKTSGKKAAAKERKPKVRKSGKKSGELYEVGDGSLKRKNRNCPKCGKGIFLGKHKDRLVCGQCGYVEMLEKKE